MLDESEVPLLTGSNRGTWLVLFVRRSAACLPWNHAKVQGVAQTHGFFGRLDVLDGDWLGAHNRVYEHAVEREPAAQCPARLPFLQLGDHY